SFLLLCGGMVLLGVYTAFGKYYRFAAADAADVDFRARVISFTLAGGIVGGVLGPEMAKHSTDLVPGHLYMGGRRARFDAVLRHHEPVHDLDAARDARACASLQRRGLRAAVA